MTNRILIAAASLMLMVVAPLRAQTRGEPEVVRTRGGPALDPEMLRREYQDRLDAEIEKRAAEIRSGRPTVALAG